MALYDHCIPRVTAVHRIAMIARFLHQFVSVRPVVCSLTVAGPDLALILVEAKACFKVGVCINHPDCN